MQLLIALVLAFLWMPGVAYGIIMIIAAFTAGWNTLPTVSVVVSLTALSLVPTLLIMAKRNGGEINFSLMKPFFWALPVAPCLVPSFWLVGLLLPGKIC